MSISVSQLRKFLGCPDPLGLPSVTPKAFEGIGALSLAAGAFLPMTPPGKQCSKTSFQLDRPVSSRVQFVLLEACLGALPGHPPRWKKRLPSEIAHQVTSTCKLRASEWQEWSGVRQGREEGGKSRSAS